MSIGSSHSALYRTSVRSSSRMCQNWSRSRSAYPWTASFVPRSCLVLARRIADAGGEVPDDQHGDVPEVLELPELAEHDRPPEGHGRRPRVEPELHAQGSAERELALEPVGRRPRPGR